MIQNKLTKLATHSETLVTTSGDLVLDDNDRRVTASIVNASNVPIYIKFGSAPLYTTDGIYIAPGGFGYEIDERNLWRGKVYAVHDGTGSKLVTCVEFQ